MTTVIPALRVSSRAVVDQWVAAFGLELVALHGEGGAVEHAELRLGDGWVMASTPRGNDFDTTPGGTSLYFVLDEPAAVDALHARAVAGAPHPPSSRTTRTTAGATAPCATPTATSGRSAPTRQATRTDHPGIEAPGLPHV